MEIGTFHGANIISVGLTYGLHKESKLYCIDPWEDYDEYDEYKNEQSRNYETFIENVKNSGFEDKIIINRGFSNKEINKFDDNFFDIIYIDGNHEADYVLEDAVSSFRKLKVNGILIFDDYGWYSSHEVEKAVDAFVSAYCKRIEYLKLVDKQVFIKKIN